MNYIIRNLIVLFLMLSEGGALEKTRFTMCLKCGFSVEILWKNCGSRVPQFFPFSTIWN